VPVFQENEESVIKEEKESLNSKFEEFVIEDYPTKSLNCENFSLFIYRSTFSNLLFLNNFKSKAPFIFKFNS
jgi:hypothetical protein